MRLSNISTKTSNAAIVEHGQSNLLEQVLNAISPASISHATDAVRRIRQGGPISAFGHLPEIAARLSSACHCDSPSVDRATLIVVAADHGVSLDNASSSALTTATAAAEIAERSSPMRALLSSHATELLVVDAGIRAPIHSKTSDLLSFRIGDGTADFRESPAMTRDCARSAIDAGIALLYSQAESGIDVLAIAQFSLGSKPSSDAVLEALSESTSAETIRPALSGSSHCAIDILACIGGFDHGVLVGLILAATSLHIPILIDNYGAAVSALIALRIDSTVHGYLFVSDCDEPGHVLAMNALKLSPLPSPSSCTRGQRCASAISLLRAAAEVLGAMDMEYR